MPFAIPAAAERATRIGTVLQVLYLIFNEGYAVTAGPSLLRRDLSAEATRLTRLLHTLMPGDGEVTGLLALMLLTDARRPARIGRGGDLIPMADQDRSLWSAESIAEGVAMIGESLRQAEPGPYQIQATIAAVHDQAPTAEATDWPRIVELYEILLRLSDNPVVALNHAVAVAMAHGPQAGLDLLEGLSTNERIASGHRIHAVRAHLLELTGDHVAARENYLEAARRTGSLPRQRYLHGRAARLTDAE